MYTTFLTENESSCGNTTSGSPVGDANDDVEGVEWSERVDGCADEQYDNSEVVCGFPSQAEEWE